MPELGDVGLRISDNAELLQQFIVPKGGGCIAGRCVEQAADIELCEQLDTLRLCSQAIEPDSVKPLENLTMFTMLGQPATFGHEALNIFEPGNDALRARCEGTLVQRGGVNAKLG